MHYTLNDNLYWNLIANNSSHNCYFHNRVSALKTYLDAKKSLSEKSQALTR